ncbi:tautomerase family protein [Actinomadura fulvescens]|uniref:Tautomerase family protein n=1 Tax=Actinomadura fulvescens TaxID=46160 RepID=A0ABN3PVF5_9ACTN
MTQVKIYARRDVWAERRGEISDLVQECLAEAWRLPDDKRFQRFLWLGSDDLVAPQRGERYLVIEILCFTGRGEDAKRALIRTFYERLCAALDLGAADLELTIIEMPAVNWGIRGVPADELTLSYPVEL